MQFNPSFGLAQSAGTTDNNKFIDAGPFTAARTSLRSGHISGWFRDAKFGIWAHWGPQSAVEYGD